MDMNRCKPKNYDVGFSHIYVSRVSCDARIHIHFNGTANESIAEKFNVCVAQCFRIILGKKTHHFIILLYCAWPRIRKWKNGVDGAHMALLRGDSC